MSIFQAWVVKGIRFWWQFLDAVSTVPQNLWVDHLFAEFGFYPSSRNIWSFFGGTISHGTLKARFVSGRLACKSKISMGCPIKVSGSILYPNSSGIQIALPAKSSDEATKRPCGETTSDFETNTYHSWLTQWFLYLPDSEVGCFATANAGHKWHEASLFKLWYFVQLLLNLRAKSWVLYSFIWPVFFSRISTWSCQKNAKTWSFESMGAK